MNDKRAINGFPGYYVSADGSVWSDRTGKVRRLSVYRRPYGSKYVVVCLRKERGKGGKIHTLYVHRLILESFAGEAPARYQACHNDGDTSNNTLSNLRWDTPLANQADCIRHGRRPRGSKHPTAKYTEAQVIEAIALRSQGLSRKEVGARIGISEKAVGSVTTGRNWKHLRQSPAVDQ